MRRNIKTSILITAVIIWTGLFFAGSEAFGKTSKKPALLLKEADQCRKTLYDSAKGKKYRNNWLRCINSYKKIYTRYPKSSQAPWAIYSSAGMFTKLYIYSGRKGDLEEALGLYRQVVSKFNSHRLADDAQYSIGRIYYKYKKDPTHAYVEFLKVEIKFPLGDMLPEARKMMDKLTVILSKKSENKGTEINAVSKHKLVDVKDIRHWSTPNYTRVVIDLQSPVKYEHHLLKADPNSKKPRRIYLDIKNAHVTSRIDRPIAIKGDLLKRARAGQYTKENVRVVLDIESIGGYQVFHLHDPFRIVVDVKRTDKRVAKSKPKPTLKKRAVRKGIWKPKAPGNKLSLARQLGLNVKRIVIDPGHGGKDPGCLSRKGPREKDIVLGIAKALAKKIKKKIGCDVFLTRDRDISLSLERRTAIANMKKADLFISLHVNAHKRKSIYGLETYFLNMATDERSMLVAARENATSEKNISDLQMILNDLMLNTKINESNRLAHEVQRGLISGLKKKYKRVKNLGVKQAPFYVLIGAQMPAILIETGFITNYTEKKRLMSRKYREYLAEGICAGIKAYIKSSGQAYRGG